MMVGNADTETQTHLESIPFLGHCFLLGVLFVLLGLFQFLHVQEALFNIALKFETSLFTVEGLTARPLRLEISVSLFFLNISRRFCDN